MNKKSKGQAVVEYLIFLVIMVTIAYNLVLGMHNFMASNIGGLAVVLSNQLKSGVCKEACFYYRYKNVIEDER